MRRMFAGLLAFVLVGAGSGWILWNVWDLVLAGLAVTGGVGVWGTWVRKRIPPADRGPGDVKNVAQVAETIHAKYDFGVERSWKTIEVALNQVFGGEAKPGELLQAIEVAATPAYERGERKLRLFKSVCRALAESGAGRKLQ